MGKVTRKLSVSDILTSDVVTISPTETIEDALELLVENGISALPVTVRGGRCVGVLSATDLLNLTQELGEEFGRQFLMKSRGRQLFLEQLVNDGLAGKEVRELMTPEVISVRPDTSLKEAAMVIVRNHVHRLVVLDENDELVGIVSTLDILATLAEIVE